MEKISVGRAITNFSFDMKSKKHIRTSNVELIRTNCHEDRGTCRLIGLTGTSDKRPIPAWCQISVSV